jgi:hypothetical protein
MKARGLTMTTTCGALAVLLATGSPALGDILYVKPGGTGNGSSWEQALGSVQDALAIATDRV